MNDKQMEKAKKIIKKHYCLDRDVTNQEVIDEINNLKRKGIDVLYLTGFKDLYYQLERVGIISYDDLTSQNNT